MKPYKYLMEREKEAVNITLEFWKYASETGCENKGSWNKYTILIKYPFACGICYIAGYMFTCCLEEIICKKCFLYHNISDSYCGLFRKWHAAKSKREKKKFANEIYKRILKYVKGE